ncbi:MAG: hypothetical protein IJ882_02480 [Paludibacteraceae bacterium]|nr:hypothetical protein [Paludibacteraceae bacterium]
MKKQYICPSFECTAVRYISALCSGSGTNDTINGSGTTGGSQGGSRAPKF